MLLISGFTRSFSFFLGGGKEGTKIPSVGVIKEVTHYCRDLYDCRALEPGVLSEILCGLANRYQRGNIFKEVK